LVKPYIDGLILKEYFNRNYFSSYDSICALALSITTSNAEWWNKNAKTTFHEVTHAIGLSSSRLQWADSLPNSSTAKTEGKR
jgi:hypothetical protein